MQKKLAPSHNKSKPESVGRKYTTTPRFHVHSRRMSPQGEWGGTAKYETQAEAVKEVQKMLRSYGRPQRVGSLTIEIEDDGTRFEYRVVKVVSECEIVHLEH